MKVVTQEEIANIIMRIYEEGEIQAKFMGVEFNGFTAIEVCDKVRERIGGDWEIKEGVK